MNIVVVDLEMCTVSKEKMDSGVKIGAEIIEIGAVKLNDKYEQISEYRSFVSPEIGELTEYITDLTGIEQSDIKDAPKFKEALDEFLDWIGEEDFKIYAWSNSDYHQVKSEAKYKQIDDECYKYILDKKNWVDYQKVFSKRIHYKTAVALSDAVKMAEIKNFGRYHDGLDDAKNTALLISKMELNPDYQVKCLEDVSFGDEHLNVTMGDLFAGLNFVFDNDEE